MPELPEVETIKSGLQSLVGQKILHVKVHHFGLRYPIDANISTKLTHKCIISIKRRAKYLIFELTTGYLIIHLGMSGSLILSDQFHSETLKKHDHFELLFSKHILRYNDPRRFGAIIYTTNPNTHQLLLHLGVEPLTEEFSAKHLEAKLKGKKTTIKQAIMDNHVVVGVGNIYACEALFLAHILPDRLSNSLTKIEIERLVFAIKHVLTNAIQLGGSTLRDYKHADNTLGYFQNLHNVYGRASNPCQRCNTNIKQKRLGQRNSFYCPKCQK